MAEEIILEDIEIEQVKIKELIRDGAPKKEVPVNKELVRKYTANAKKTNLYSRVVNELSDGMRNTPDQLSYLDAYERALSVFRASALKIRERIDVLTLEERLASLKSNGDGTEKAKQNVAQAAVDLEAEIKDAIMFSNRYALYFAGQVGLGLLNSKAVKTEQRLVFGPDNYSSKERDDLCAKLATMAGEDLTRVVAVKKEKGESVSDVDLKSTFESIFTNWIHQFNWERHTDIAKKYSMDSTKLRFGNFSLENGNFKRSYSDVRVDEFMNVRKEDVIGAADFQKVIWDNMMRLLAYDPEKKENPLDPAKVIFTTGDPGCGKTYIVHALTRSLGDVAKDLGIALWAFPFSITDFGTEYKDKAAIQLAEVARQIKEFPGAVIQYVADADTLFKSRKDARATQEDQKVMSVFFSMYDGTRIPRNGKFMAIMDANYITDIDDATKSRLFDEILTLERFKTPEEFGEYAKRYLTKGSPVIGVNPNEWSEVGKYLLEGPLSNREIEHVLRGLRRGYEIPLDILRKPYNEKVAFRNQHFQGITRPKIIEAVSEYVDTRMQMERASREALVNENAERFLSSIRQPGTDYGTNVGGK